MSIYAANLLRQLVAAGHDVTMVSQYRGDAFGRAVYGGGPPPPVPGVTVMGVEQSGEQSTGDFERDIDVMVDTIVRAHQTAPFDVLHAQYGYPTGWATLIAARRLRLPCVVSIQGGDGHWVGSCCETHRLAMVRVLEGADALLIGGESFADEVSARLHVPSELFTIVPGAVDTGRFRPGPDHAGPVRLLYHGRVDARKGVLDFLHALVDLPGGWSATISGIGPDMDAAKALAATLAVPVTFTGYADYGDVPAIYAAHDIFVSPTYAEGFSNTILEAMASGLAVVSCRSVGVVDCIRSGENGLLVEPGDVGALSDALGRLVAEPDKRRALAEAALVECQATYSWDTVGARILQVYADLAGRTTFPPLDTDLPMTACRFRQEPHLL